MLTVQKIANGTFSVSKENRDGYIVERAIFHFPAEERDQMKQRPEWGSKTKHPVIRDEELKGYILFDDLQACLSYLSNSQVKRSPQLPTDFVTKEELDRMLNKFKQEMVDYQEFKKWKEAQKGHNSSKKEGYDVG